MGKPPSATAIDAKGKLVVPGMIDCHAHLFSLGQRESIVDLRSVHSIAEMKRRISEYIQARPEVASKGKWIVGRGWDQDLLPDRKLPTKYDIDAVVPENPALMIRICGHIGVLNSTALSQLKLPLDLPDKDSLVLRNDNGELNGVVKEKALENCLKEIPPLTQSQLYRVFLRAQDLAIEKGLAGVHCIFSENWKNELKVVSTAEKEGRLRLMLSIFLPVSALHHVESLEKQHRTHLLSGRNYRVIGFKLYADGSLGARTAALNSPYNDDPNNDGILNYSDEEIERIARKVKSLGFILASHAIGDRAIEQVLRAYRAAGIMKKDGFRIEHCSIVPRRSFKSLKGLVASVQPSFCTSDYWIKDRLGANRKSAIAYPLKKLSFTTLVIGGSDSPVEDIDPLKGICSATSNPIRSESLSVYEALKFYTVNAARASPLTRHMGKVAKGNRPDLVVLDIASPIEICNAKASFVLLNGEPLQN